VPRRTYAELADNYGTSAIQMKIAALLAVSRASAFMRNIVDRRVITAPTAPTLPLATLVAALTTDATMQVIVERPPWVIPASPITPALRVFVSIMCALPAQNWAWVPSVRV